MDKRYQVEGLFNLEVDAERPQEAKDKVERILRADGIENYIVDVEEVEGMEK